MNQLPQSNVPLPKEAVMMKLPKRLKGIAAQYGWDGMTESVEYDTDKIESFRIYGNFAHVDITANCLGHTIPIHCIIREGDPNFEFLKRLEKNNSTPPPRPIPSTCVVCGNTCAYCAGKCHDYIFWR